MKHAKGIFKSISNKILKLSSLWNGFFQQNIWRSYHTILYCQHITKAFHNQEWPKELCHACIFITVIGPAGSLTLQIQPGPIRLVPPVNFCRHSIPQFCLPIRDNCYLSPCCVFWSQWWCFSYLRLFPLWELIQFWLESMPK